MLAKCHEKCQRFFSLTRVGIAFIEMRGGFEMQPIVEVLDVCKDYALGKVFVHALSHVSLTLLKGEFTTIAGPSGSGKTTLLNLIGCMDVPTSGIVRVSGQETNRLNDRALTELRLRHLGFIFQSFNLVQVLSVFQNIEFPLLLQGALTPKERRLKVEQMIEQVGLSDHVKHRPNELSGGQRQRVAIARALVTNPSIVLADEPTANLDSVTGGAILDLMKSMNTKQQTTFIFSTHDARVMEHADRIIKLVDGRIYEGA